MGDLTRAKEAFQAAVTSKSQERANINNSSLETARARLAALNSGALQPAIPAAPSKAASATSIPTPAADRSRPLPPVRSSSKGGGSHL